MVMEGREYYYRREEFKHGFVFDKNLDDNTPGDV